MVKIVKKKMDVSGRPHAQFTHTHIYIHISFIIIQVQCIFLPKSKLYSRECSSEDGQSGYRCRSVGYWGGGGGSSSVNRARDFCSGGPGFDSSCSCPLSTGWVAVSNRLRQKPWSLRFVSCVAARRIVRRHSWDPFAI